MTTALVATFLIAHGLVHLAIWVPKPDAGKPPPFTPQHSGALSTLHIAEQATARLAVAVAALAAGAFTIAGLGVVLSASWATVVAALAATVGLLLKVVYFHPWLSIGVLLDAAVLSAAVSGWPLTLT